MNRRKFFHRKLPRSAVVASLVIALANPGGWYRSAIAADAAPSPATSSAAAVARLTNLFNALQEAESEIPRDTFDPSAVLAKTGRNPARIFEWVRDQTFYVPYRGTLRGATGVLMDRLGNSLDRAICLAVILRSAGYTTRLANAQLNEKDAEAVLARIRPAPQFSYGPSGDSAQAEQQEARFVAKYGPDVSGARRDVESGAADAMNVAAGIVQRATDQSPLIIAAIGKPRNQADDHPRDLAAIKDLWWVQLQQGSAWKDLDPTAGDAQFGTGVAKASRMINFDVKADRFALDASLPHLLKIRVVTEKWEAGKLAENVLLDHEIRPSEVIGKRIAFTNVPLKWPELPDKEPPEGIVNFLKSAALNAHEWVPVLGIGDQRVFAAGVNDAGVRNESPVYPSGAAQLGQGIGGVFGSALGGEEPTIESFFTAEWIEYEIYTPGTALRKIRREVFDLVGPAARAAGAVPKPAFSDNQRIQRCLSLNGALEILPQPCRLSPEFCADLAIRQMMANRRPLLDLAGAPDFDEPHLRSLRAKMTPLPGAIYDLAQMRWVCSPVAGNVYLDRINVIALGERMRLTNPAGPSLLRQFDIVANDVAVRAGAGSDAFSIRVTQGVTETNAEALLLKTGEAGISHNAGESLNKALGTDRWAVARKSGDPPLAEGQFSADVKARIASDITDAQVVLIRKDPSSADDVSWWRVDPITGQTLGIGPNGAGQAVVETVLNRVLICFAVGLGATDICLYTSWFAAHNRTNQRAAKCLLIGLAVGMGMSGNLFTSFKIAAFLIAGAASATQGAL
ncbi:MAG: hypothetical protein JWO48_2312 [Bryobacterales bacterium]|nr:hypothetical protein [Bryobacterales bacterium]